MSGTGRAYPPEWSTVSRAIRYTRAQGRCECEGECGLHRTHPGPRRCVERDGQAALWAKGKVVLTVAHLNGRGGPCRCTPLCADPAHLKAMCNRCHLRYDVELHVRNGRATRRQGAALGDLFDTTPSPDPRQALIDAALTWGPRGVEVVRDAWGRIA